jgi:hypothetical protein
MAVDTALVTLFGNIDLDGVRNLSGERAPHCLEDGFKVISHGCKSKVSVFGHQIPSLFNMTYVENFSKMILASGAFFK